MVEQYSICGESIMKAADYLKYVIAGILTVAIPLYLVSFTIDEMFKGYSYGEGGVFVSKVLLIILALSSSAIILFKFLSEYETYKETSLKK